MIVPQEILDFLKRRYGDYEIYIVYAPYVIVFDGTKQEKVELQKFATDNYVFWAAGRNKIYLFKYWVSKEDKRG